MMIDGEELREIVGRTPNMIEIRKEHDRCCRIRSEPRRSPWVWTFLWVSETGVAFGFCASSVDCSSALNNLRR
jgi:hypothetical protein